MQHFCMDFIDCMCEISSLNTASIYFSERRVSLSCYYCGLQLVSELTKYIAEFCVFEFVNE